MAGLYISPLPTSKKIAFDAARSNCRGHVIEAFGATVNSNSFKRLTSPAPPSVVRRRRVCGFDKVVDGSFLTVSYPHQDLFSGILRRLEARLKSGLFAKDCLTLSIFGTLLNKRLIVSGRLNKMNFSAICVFRTDGALFVFTPPLNLKPDHWKPDLRLISTLSFASEITAFFSCSTLNMTHHLNQKYLDLPRNDLATASGATLLRLTNAA